MKCERYFDDENCPMCGGALMVEVECNHDPDAPVFYTNGDEVWCTDCIYESSLSVDEESGKVWVHDNLMDYDDE